MFDAEGEVGVSGRLRKGQGFMTKVVYESS